jgi:hypothetical protein
MYPDVGQTANIREGNKDHCCDMMTDHLVEVSLRFGSKESDSVLQVISETDDVVGPDSPVGSHTRQVYIHLLDYS